VSALPALAGPDDLSAQLPAPLNADQLPAAATALANASTAVRAYTRRKFTLDSYTTRLRAKGHWILLPQRPVVSVESLSVMVWGNLTPTVGWVWDGLDRIWVGGIGTVINLPEEIIQAIEFGVTVAEVSYTAGYQLVPDDVVAVTAGLAARAMSIPAGGVVSSQTAGPFSQTVAGWAQGGPLALSDADKVILRQYKRPSASIEMRS
jgi:hypothetical protein